MIGFKNETLTRAIYSAATYDANGFPSRGTATAGSVVGSLQPLSDKERLTLPEGIRYTADKKFYTATALTFKDVLTRSNGEKYEVIQIQEFTNYGLGTDHYKVYLQKVE